MAFMGRPPVPSALLRVLLLDFPLYFSCAAVLMDLVQPVLPCGGSGLALLNAGRVGRIREKGNCQPSGDLRADAVDIAREHHPADGMLRDGK